MRHHRQIHHQLIAASVSILCALNPLAGQEFRQWVGESGAVWESPTNWNPTLVPDTITEAARVSGAIVNVGTSFTLGALEILGAGNVVMNQSNLMTVDRLVAAGGSLSGTGAIDIRNGGGMSGSIGHTWNGLTVTVGGTFDVKNLTLTNSPTVENTDTMVFDDGDTIGDTNLITLPEPLPTTFFNTGFLRKETGTATAIFSARFVNDGEIFSQAGTLQIPSGGINNGAIRTEGDGIVRMASLEITFTDGSSISGTGTTKVASGFITAEADAVIPVNNFTMEGLDSRIGGEGSFELTGEALEFKAGRLIDSVTVRLTEGSSLVVSGGVSLDDSALLINEAGAVITMNAASSSFTNNGITTLRNLGIIELTNDGDLTNNGPFGELSFMTLDNDGVISKTGGTGTSQFANVIENDGEISSSSGTLLITSTGVNRSVFTTSGDGIIRINSNDLLFADGSSITGTGTTRVSSGFIKAAEGATVAVNNFLSDQSGSRIGGSGEFQFSGDALEFKGGQSRETVTMRILDGASLAVTGGFTLNDTTTLINDAGGLITLTAANSNFTNSGLSTIRNNGTIDIANDGDITNNGPLSQFSFTSIENNGSILKTGGTGDSFLTFGDYSGDGLLRVETGTIRLSGISGRNTLTGEVEILSGANLRGASTLNFAPGSTVSGEGSIRSTFVNFSGTTAPGMSIGTLAVTGNAVLEATATLETELGQAGASDKLAVSGNATAGGNLVITLDGVQPADGDSWTILEAATVSGTFDSVSTPAAPENFGYYIDYDPQGISVHYEFINFRRAVELATGNPIPSTADLADLVDADSDGDGLSDLLEWVFGTNIAGEDSGRGMEIISFDDQTPQTVRFRAPANPLALDAVMLLEMAGSPEGPYMEVPMIALPGQDEVIDGLPYKVFEVQIAGGPAQSRFYRLTARLANND